MGMGMIRSQVRLPNELHQITEINGHSVANAIYRLNLIEFGNDECYIYFWSNSTFEGKIIGISVEMSSIYQKSIVKHTSTRNIEIHSHSVVKYFLDSNFQFEALLLTVPLK